ncbi:uncharacterized protein LY79DRAFT_18084 [Colletotrichum navitas]|uniref:Uncharacterized protein n=1 Tax=Colletotrichum navitas TaxID=681940 RepID=A0AAD8VCU1_9PEZI|nr:uncharacterized protein LY79DRAFT_18084 [Colletotrichum navitas]KAK1600411.1 hypothetical protein LY79DRAFT_18084 [Colletotrichum navitas]
MRLSPGKLTSWCGHTKARYKRRRRSYDDDPTLPPNRASGNTRDTLTRILPIWAPLAWHSGPVTTSSRPETKYLSSGVSSWRWSRRRRLRRGSWRRGPFLEHCLAGYEGWHVIRMAPIAPWTTRAQQTGPTQSEHMRDESVVWKAGIGFLSFSPHQAALDDTPRSSQDKPMLSSHNHKPGLHALGVLEA